MLNTKLIFVDGISGSGKSTTAHYIARQLEKNGIKVKWLYEQEKNHPFRFISDIDEKELVKQENQEKWFLEFRDKYCAQIEKFVESINDDEYVYIVEAWFLSNTLSNFIQRDQDLKVIDSFYDKYCSVISKLNPVTIYFHQNNLDAAQRETWRRRGEFWKKTAIKTKENFYFCRRRNILGEEAYLTYLKAVRDIAKSIHSKLPFHKLQIESSAHNWEDYHMQIGDFLGIKLFSEMWFKNSFEKYFGYYQNKKMWFKIHADHNYLYIDEYYPNQKLIPLSEDEFEIEGYGAVIRFISNDDNIVESLRVTKDLCQFIEGLEFTKLSVVNLSTDEQSKFCANYLNQLEKLDYKIYLKDNNLYYWQSDNNETILIPISQTKLAIYGTQSTIEFNRNSETKEFELNSPNHKDLLFIQTNL